MLIGRDLEVAEVQAALDNTRLVTLVGPGGVGKTTLANAVAADHPEDSVLAVSLAPITESDLQDSVAGSLGFSSRSHMVDDLERRSHLLLLDNCEHVVDAAAEFVEWLLSEAPGVRILATSRERLDLDSERVIRIEPLSTEGSPSPAGELFRAAMTRRGATAADDAAVIDELCRRLDRLPLALELAASRTSAMTAAEILDNLRAGTSVLTRGRRRGPDRHRSLSAAVSWSHRQLDDVEHRVFSSLAVLTAPFTVEMAAAVADLQVPDVRTVLTTLVDRSLLVHQPVAGSSWYRMLETIRSFADERLGAEDRPGAEERLIQYLCERADAMGIGAVMIDAAVPVELTRSFRTVHWAVERCLADDDKARCHRLLMPFWSMAEVGHQSESIELIQRVIDRWPSDRSVESGACVGFKSALLLASRSREEAAAAAELAVTGGGIGAAFGERTLGLVAAGQGRWDDALGHFERGIELAEEAGQKGLAVEIALNAALTSARADEVEPAVAQLEQLRAASVGLDLAHSWSTDFLSYVLLPIEPARSAELSTGLLEVGERTDNGWITAASHTNLAFAALLADEPEAAADHLVRSITAYLHIRDRHDVTLAFLAAAAVFVRRGDIDSAQATLATERSYTDAAVGGFEADLLDRVGPLPERDPDAAPLSTTEIVRRLQLKPTGPAAAADPKSIQATAVPKAINRFMLVGDSWEISYGGATILQRNSKGLADIARLLAKPDREWAAVDLAGAGVVAGDAGPLSDSQARQHYQQRIRDLQAEIEDAEANVDSHRAERARTEMDQLIDHLTAAYGMQGTPRRDGDPAEKARSAVTARIRSAIKRIGETHPELQDHLERNVRTGRFCVYSPPTDPGWATS